MKYLLLFIFHTILVAIGFAQDSGITHKLELLTSNQDQPIILDISINVKEQTKYILIAFPEESVKTEYINADSSQIKFQISQIRNDKLLTIQFIGNGDINSKIEGKFIALVDGILRDDMSGTFELKKNKL